MAVRIETVSDKVTPIPFLEPADLNTPGSERPSVVGGGIFNHEINLCPRS